MAIEFVAKECGSTEQVLRLRVEIGIKLKFVGYININFGGCGQIIPSNWASIFEVANICTLYGSL
jgi:hypothetical protein